jgi:hypothetical protein
MTQQQDTLHQQLSALIAKATKDEAFRERLLRNPQATVEQESIVLPPDMHIQVHEDTPTMLHLILSPKTHAGDLMELSDTELAAITGGAASNFDSDPNGARNIINAFGYE